MIEDPEAKLKALHAKYCAMTGLDLRYQCQQRLWLDYWREGFTIEDLELVLNYVLASNRKNDFQYSTRINSLIGDLSKFDGLRAEALKAASLRKPNYNKNAVLRATGRPEELPGGCKTGKEAIIHLTDEIRKAVG